MTTWLIAALITLTTAETLYLAYLITEVRRQIKEFDTTLQDAESDLGRIDQLYIEARRKLDAP